MVTHQSGFTLIELMITIAIIALLAVVAAPYTSSWIHEANVNEAKSTLHRAHGQAKAIALRNPNGVMEGNQVAASVKLDNGVLLACRGEPDQLTCAAGDATGIVGWQGNWPAGVSIDDADSFEARINNRGQILDENDSPVHEGITFSLSKGSVADNDEYNRLR